MIATFPLELLDLDRHSVNLDASSTFRGNLVVGAQSEAPLSELNNDIGVIVAGRLQNKVSSPTAGIRLDSSTTLPGTWTTYLDCAATGSDPVLAHNELSLNADGTANWSVDVLNVPALTAADAGGTWDAVNTETDYSVTWEYNSLVSSSYRLEIQFYHNGGLIDIVSGIAHTASQPYLHSVDSADGAASGGTVSVIVVLYDNSTGSAVSSIATRERIQAT